VVVVGVSGLTGGGVMGLWEIRGGGLDGVSVGSLAGEVVAMILPLLGKRENKAAIWNWIGRERSVYNGWAGFGSCHIIVYRPSPGPRNSSNKCMLPFRPKIQTL
jgi:hypothetical protein